LLANVASNYLVGGIEPQRMGNAHFNIAPYEVFRARDRWFTLAAANSIQWEALCDVIDRPELKDDPRFADNQRRLAERTALVEVLSEAFATRDADEWLAKLQQAGIPCGAINTIADVFNHPQAEARKLRLEIKHPTAGLIGTPGIPYKMSQTPADAHRHPPMLGEHTDEVLTKMLGYTAEEVAHLREKKAI
jgi:formyl-CoA transferase